MTNRRQVQIVLSGLFILGFLFACQQFAREDTLPSPTIADTRQYNVKQTIHIINQGNQQPEKQNLWVALIRDFPPYQVVKNREIFPQNFTIIIDEYENVYAEFDFSDHPPGTDISVEINYQVQINQLAYELEPCVGTLPEEFTQSELHIESANPQIIAISDELSIGSQNVCQKARSFYDYVATELVYSYNRNDWGAQAAVGLMGADCTEYSSLMIALSRAAGVPARYFEGLLYLEEETSDLAQTEHAWLDVYLPGIGWVPADPTLGRSPALRDTYFAHYTPDHIILTMGRNPSTLRGASYWSHLYWPGDSTIIQVNAENWMIKPVE